MANKTISELPDFSGAFGNAFIPIVDMGVADPKLRNRKITGSRLLELLGAGTPTVPANAVTLNGEPVTHNGEYVTFTPGSSNAATPSPTPTPTPTPTASVPANTVTYQGEPVTNSGAYVTYTPPQGA